MWAEANTSHLMPSDLADVRPAVRGTKQGYSELSRSEVDIQNYRFLKTPNRPQSSDIPILNLPLLITHI